MTLSSVECRVLTPYGHDISSVFSALQQKKTVATTLPHYLSPSNRSGALVPIQVGIIPTLSATIKPMERILALLQGTLMPLLKVNQACSTQNSKTENSDHLLIMIVLPAKNGVRYAYCSEKKIQEYVINHLNTVEHVSITFRFLHEDEDLISAFLQAQTKLHQGSCDRLIFGGVDSFLTVKAIRDFEAKQSIRKEGNPDAPLLGEGAAFICIYNQAPLLAKAVDTSNTLSNMPNSPYWITNRSVRLRAEFEWYESMRHYPCFQDLKELNLQKWLGHLGAAQFPLQVALGFYWANTHEIGAASPIILHNENTKKQMVLQKYRCFQRDIY